MNTTLDTLDNLWWNTDQIISNLYKLLDETNQAIANGDVPDVPPSKIIARIEYNEGYRTGLFQAITLIRQEN